MIDPKIGLANERARTHLIGTAFEQLLALMHDDDMIGKNS